MGGGSLWPREAGVSFPADSHSEASNGNSRCDGDGSFISSIKDPENGIPAATLG